MTSDKSIKRSRRLLGVYWLYKVLNGGNIAKTTLNALKIEANAARKQYADEQPLRDQSRRTATAARHASDSARRGSTAR